MKIFRLLLLLLLPISVAPAQVRSLKPVERPKTIILFTEETSKFIGPAYAGFFERALNGLNACKTESEAKLKVDKMQLKVLFTGIPASQPMGASRAFVRRTISSASFRYTMDSKTCKVIWTFSDGNVFSMSAPTNREIIEGTDVAVADKQIDRQLKDLVGRNLPLTPLPTVEASQLEASGDLFVAKGSMYDVQSMNSNLYYQLSGAAFTPVFSQSKPNESITNLLLGAITSDKHVLNVSHHGYNSIVNDLRINLPTFIAYWKNQKDFELFSGVAKLTSEGAEAYLVISHKHLNYIHLLKVTMSNKNLWATDGTFEALLFTNIPQQNISHLIK